MTTYTFSPIQTREELFEAVKFIHFACYGLCKAAFGHYLPNSGNMGVFCHYDYEFEFLKTLQKDLCEPSSNPDTKYFKLREPIVVPARGDAPETTYEYLYIRRREGIDAGDKAKVSLEILWLLDIKSYNFIN